MTSWQEALKPDWPHAAIAATGGAGECELCGDRTDKPRRVCHPCVPAWIEAERARYILDPEAMMRDLMDLMRDAATMQQLDEGLKWADMYKGFDQHDHAPAFEFGHDVDTGWYHPTTTTIDLKITLGGHTLARSVGSTTNKTGGK